MKRTFILASFALAAAALYAGYRITDTFWQALAINLATTFMSIALGLIIVNIYLERTSKRGAVRSLLTLSHQSIADFHNLLLDLCWAKYGKEGWASIMSEYINGKGKPEVLKQEVRNAVYDIYSTNLSLREKVDSLEETLVELSRLVGWNLDPELLKACLDSRISINKLKKVAVDGSPQSISFVTEHLIDTDFRSQRARRILLTIADIKE